MSLEPTSEAENELVPGPAVSLQSPLEPAAAPPLALETQSESLESGGSASELTLEFEEDPGRLF